MVPLWLQRCFYDYVNGVYKLFKNRPLGYISLPIALLLFPKTLDNYS